MFFRHLGAEPGPPLEQPGNDLHPVAGLESAPLRQVDGAIALGFADRLTASGTGIGSSPPGLDQTEPRPGLAGLRAIAIRCE